MKVTITHRYTGAVLWSGEAESLKAGVVAAVKARADLTGADLSGSDLSGSDLTGSCLMGSDLTGSDLTGSDLSGSYLMGSCLSGAKNAELVIARTRILPEGALIGWKKCKRGVLVKLRVQEQAKRSHAFGRKCRAEYVKVLEVIGAKVGETDQHGPPTEYRVGKTVRCHKWDDDYSNECSGGIHFYITREEAEAHS